ncbi:hypothetical protein D3C76_1327590 [compost metagenome]
MAAGIVDRCVVLGLDLAGAQSGAQAIHEGFVVVPLPVNVLGHAQAVRVDRYIATRRAEVIDLVACLLDVLDKMHRLTQPEPGGTFERRVFGRIGQDHQNLFAHYQTPFAGSDPVRPDHQGKPIQHSSAWPGCHSLLAVC